MSVCITKEILDAYFATSYFARVAENVIVLRIGVKSNELAALHAAHTVEISCFITAYNPFGIASSEVDNIFLNQSLRTYLRDHGITYFEGEGRGEDPHWPAEPSFLVLGITIDQARGLCCDFRQNAVVVSLNDATPVLVLHPDAVISGGRSPMCGIQP